MWGKKGSLYRAEAFVVLRERSKIAEAMGNYLGEDRQENIKEKKCM